MIVIDTETTGLGPDAQVIEFAGVWSGGSACFLVKPTIPIEPAARAAHHIPDRVLEHATLAPGWREHLERILAGHGTPVAHNAEFDLRLIRQTWPGIALPPHICTYRVSLHLWPEAPGHSNQVLRYWLGVEPTLRTNLPPHRALPDAAVTAALLDYMMTHMGKTEAELLALTVAPVVLHKVRFGKHVDTEWAAVPRDYLEWILRNGGFDADVMHTARHYLGGMK